VATMPARYAAVADPHAGLNGPDAEAFRLDLLLEMSAADERDRDLGDLPYPPDYPKMPGEPPRVQLGYHSMRARPLRGGRGLAESEEIA
jgi:hypothetical protein